VTDKAIKTLVNRFVNYACWPTQFYPSMDEVRKNVEAIIRQEQNALRVDNERLRNALRSYAECSDGCTCGDGWSHDEAVAALKDKFERCEDCKLKDWHSVGCRYAAPKKNGQV
jgi:regulator of replication initiation timing